MNAASKWILAIVGLLAANLVAMGLLIAAARSDRARVLPDYYERAVRYDQTIEQAAVSARLGWQVEARLGADSLTVTVRDRDGVLVRDARVDIEAMSRARGVVEVARAVPTDAAYVVRARWGGLYDVTIRVARGEDLYVAQQTLEAR